MKLVRALPAAILSCMIAASPVAAQPLAALGQLEPGMWQLRVAGQAPRNICVTDPAALVQLEHKRGACSRLVVANEPNSSTVSYTCAGNAGWGRTTVRVSTPRAASIDTQGIAANMPFAYVADAHRTGDCPAQNASLQR